MHPISNNATGICSLVLGAMTPASNIVFAFASILWVGGWGYATFRNPTLFARINARFGLRIATSPKFVLLTRRFGIAGMTLAGLSLIFELIMLALDLKRH